MRKREIEKLLFNAVAEALGVDPKASSKVTHLPRRKAVEAETQRRAA